MANASADSPFGARLRQWRALRGVSQLALADKVGSTARHLSFLETGPSRPSRQMVLRLGEALDVSLRERNQLLHAAGLPAVYPEAGVDSADLAPFRAALDSLLRAHLPYPAMVLDRHWNVLLANTACTRLYGVDLVGTNLVRQFLADPATADTVVNWAEVAWAGLERLRHQRDRSPSDQHLADLVALAEQALAGIPRPAQPPPDLVLCPWFRLGDRIVKTIGMAARFDATAEITLDELRIELIYPLDEAGEQFFRDAGR
ncbi:MAG TPA: helix-turn-helix transcriptional regulator [Kribbellaceae bacterium]|nr:helix-turn-helix transcriptional regulator [Kribbellaceae bacterium]